MCFSLSLFVFWIIFMFLIGFIYSGLVQLLLLLCFCSSVVSCCGCWVMVSHYLSVVVHHQCSSCHLYIPVMLFLPLFFCWEPRLLHCLSGCVSLRFQPKTLNPRSLLIKIKTKSIQAAQSLENLKFVLTVSMGVLLANKVGPIHDPQN